MSLITLILSLALIGFLLWLVVNYVPMEAQYKKMLVIAVIAIVVLWLLYAMGIVDRFDTVRVPRVRD